MCNPGVAFPPIPADTVCAAQSLIELNSLYCELADELQTIFTLCHLDEIDDPQIGDPPQFLQRTIVTFLQTAEMLSDAQAAEATRTRLDWKYALHLPLQHPGFQAQGLCLFRQKLLAEPRAYSLFQAIQEQAMMLKCWPGAAAVLETSDQTLAFICHLNQTDWMVEAMRQALAALAGLHPEWLRNHALPHWYVSYPARRQADSAAAPISSYGRHPSHEFLWQDVHHLLAALAQDDATELAHLPEIRRLRCAWQLQREAVPVSISVYADCAHCVVGASIAKGLLQA